MEIIDIIILCYKVLMKKLIYLNLWMFQNHFSLGKVRLFLGKSE